MVILNFLLPDDNALLKALLSNCIKGITGQTILSIHHTYLKNLAGFRVSKLTLQAVAVPLRQDGFQFSTINILVTDL
jgi:hypothetical protein